MIRGWNKVVTDSYIYKCKNNGRCRQLEFENAGFHWNPNWSGRYGMSFVEVVPQNFASRIHFQCCTQCHLPKSSIEEIYLNEKLGLTRPSFTDLMAELDSLLDED